MLSPGTEVEHNEHRTVLISHSPFKTHFEFKFAFLYYYKTNELNL